MGYMYDPIAPGQAGGLPLSWMGLMGKALFKCVAASYEYIGFK